MNQTIYAGDFSGVVTVPSSKSIAHRKLICSALGQNCSTIKCRGISRDIQSTINCLNAMGAKIEIDQLRDLITVEPIRRIDKDDISIPGSNHDISIQGSKPDNINIQKLDCDLMSKNNSRFMHLYCGESGSTLRFLIPVSGALGIKAVFHLEGRLAQRPMEPYIEILEEHGMRFRYESGENHESTDKAETCFSPESGEKQENLLHVSGQLIGGSFEIPGNISSQYITGLLMALPLIREDSYIMITDGIESKGYIDLTEKSLKEAGIIINKKSENEYSISKEQKYMPKQTEYVEGDYSNAAFFMCMGALSDGGITVKGLDPDSVQGDKKILEIIKDLGADVRIDTDGIKVKKGKLREFKDDSEYMIDAGPIPDLIPVVSVLCALHKGMTRIVNVARLRFKESDRIEATVNMLSILGGDISVENDDRGETIVIKGVPYLHGGTVDSKKDHRIAMAAAVAAAGLNRSSEKVECINIIGSECVEKSYPHFWEDINAIVIDNTNKRIRTNHCTS